MDVDGISEVIRRNHFDSQIEVSDSNLLKSSSLKDKWESITMFKPSPTIIEKPEVVIDLRKSSQNFESDRYQYLPWKDDPNTIIKPEKNLWEDYKIKKGLQIDVNDEDTKTEKGDINYQNINFSPINAQSKPLKYTSSVKNLFNLRYPYSYKSERNKYRYRGNGKTSTEFSQR